MALYNSYFYNHLTRKYITVIGSLFNNIQVVRKEAGQESCRERVPLTYAPKEKYVYKLKKDLDLTNRGPAVKLPRMSFELAAMDYDPARKVMSGRRVCIVTDTEGTKYAYAATPYLLTFNVTLYTKTQDDMDQIVEQIVPFFTPDYSVAIKPIEGGDLREVIPIILQSVVPSDSYEGSFDDRRVIMWNMTFTMPVNYWGPIRGGRTTPTGPDDGIIYSTKTSVNTMDGELISTAIGVPSQAGSPPPTPQEIDLTLDWDFDLTYYDGNDTVPPYP